MLIAEGYGNRLHGFLRNILTLMVFLDVILGATIKMEQLIIEFREMLLIHLLVVLAFLLIKPLKLLTDFGGLLLKEK